MSLYLKIHSIMEELTHVGKDTKVSFEKVNYAALTEVHLLELVRPLLVKYRLLLFPKKLSHFSRDAKVTSMAAEYVIIDVDTHEQETFVSAGQGADTQDKGAGKAMTYMNKYAILKLFQLPMKDDDPDLRTSAEIDSEQEEVNVICDELKQMITKSGLDPALKEKYLRTVADIRESQDIGRAKAAKPVVQNLIKHLPPEEDDGREVIDHRPDPQD